MTSPAPRPGAGARRRRRRRRCSSELRGERRAIAIRVGGEERWIDAADAGLYRDALGAAPPGGLPAAFLEDVPDALTRLVTRYAATHGPFTADERARPVRRSTPRRRCASSSATASSSEASSAPAAPSASGATPRCCGGCAAPRWRCCARRSSPPTSARWRASCPAGRASTATRPRAPGSTGCARCWCRCRGWRCRPRSWERDVLPRRIGAYSPAWMDQLCASGELVWIGAGALGRNSGRVALYFREDLALLGTAAVRGAEIRRDRPSSTTRSARGWRPGPASSPICWSTSSSRPRRSRRRCGISSGRARPPTTRSRRCARPG